mgnify:CR=1 FL=1
MFDFNILECKRFIAPSANTVIKRTVHNYELDYYIKGDRIFHIDGEKYVTGNGYICFRRPGQEVYSFGDYNCYIMTIDFSKETPVGNYERNSTTIMEKIYDNSLINSIPPTFHPFHSGALMELFSSLSEQPDLNCETSLLLANEILYLIGSDVCRLKFEDEKIICTPADKAIKYINKHYRENISLDELARAVNLDKSYLCRLFKKHFGFSPNAYIITLRLNNARNLLLNTNMSVNEIASACGYNNTSFFIEHYKKFFNTTPGRDRQEIWG